MRWVYHHDHELAALFAEMLQQLVQSWTAFHGARGIRKGGGKDVAVSQAESGYVPLPACPGGWMAWGGFRIEEEVT